MTVNIYKFNNIFVKVSI